jgi:transcriptional regulator with XRE-family HTH domain
VNRQTPTLQRRRLVLALKEARERAQYTQKAVATALDWSPSKLLRIENGQVSISTTDLHALLQQYQVRDRRQIEAMSEMAKEARKPSPFVAYRTALTEAFANYLDYESSALRIRTFENVLIPGILQTREYAESVVRAYSSPETSESLIQQRIEARLKRQELLHGPDSPDFYFIVDESALRRVVGVEPSGAGPETMLNQLEHLKTVAKMPNVHLQIVPFTAGAYGGLTGPFSLLEFAPEVQLSEILYLENARGDAVNIEQPDVTGPYMSTFFGLEDTAIHESQLEPFLDRVINDLQASSEVRVNPTDTPTAESA